MTGREQRTRVKGSDNDRFTRDEMHYNADGQVVLRREYAKVEEGDWQFGNPDDATAPKPNTRYVYSQGQSAVELSEERGGLRTIGSGSERGPAQLAANGVAGMDGHSRAGGGSVVVQPGDTLVSLSQRVYGSGSYWYVLAEANGYDGADAAPPPGLSLRAPAVSVTRNDSGTYRPFNPAETLGPSTPSLPFVPPSSNGCGPVGQLLMVVVAVIVTVYTAGAASGFTGSFMATMSQGASVMAGTAAGMTGGAMMTAAAIGGAVGSVASQAVGLATGTIQSFSWRGVATSALTAGVGAGVGGLIGNPLLRAGAAGLGSAAVSSAINDGGFSWRQVAANVVGNAVGGAIGGAIGGAFAKGAATMAGQFAAGMAGKMIGGMVSMHARRALGSEERVNYANVAADAFANTLLDRWTGGHKTRRPPRF